jgi:hypothetical protein
MALHPARTMRIAVGRNFKMKFKRCILLCDVKKERDSVTSTVNPRHAREHGRKERGSSNNGFNATGRWTRVTRKGRSKRHVISEDAPKRENCTSLCGFT